MQSISVVIPAYNEEKYIGSCLTSIERFRTSAVIEIIVVNNASTDETARIASSFQNVRVVSEEKKGLTCARQKGLMTATGDLIAWLDADTRVDERWFQTLQRTFRNHPTAVALSGPYDYYDLPSLQRRVINSYWKYLAFPVYGFTKCMLVGGNFVAKRSALLAMGGFDTSVEFYGEDTNTAKRLMQFGDIVFDPTFVVETSGRRLAAEGIVRTALVYTANYISQLALKKTVTHSYRDYR